jgi:hypothetical protein
MARVKKPKPRSIPRYPTSGRIHILKCYELFIFAYDGTSSRYLLSVVRTSVIWPSELPTAIAGAFKKVAKFYDDPSIACILRQIAVNTTRSESVKIDHISEDYMR